MSLSPLYIPLHIALQWKKITQTSKDIKDMKKDKEIEDRNLFIFHFGAYREGDFQ